MKIKQVLKQCLPSMRARDTILDRLNEVDEKITDFDSKNEYLFWLSQHRKGETMLETKKRVFLEMPRAEGNVRDFQIVANYILQRVKKICDENGLQLLLSGGTMLGAVRHQGFIPWDDDVDIFIFRDDFIRLEQLLSNDSEIVLQRCYYKYPFTWGFIDKIKLKESEMFYIDVFPLELFCSDEENRDMLFEESRSISFDFYREITPILEKTGIDFSRIFRPTAIPEIDEEIKKIESKYISDFHTKYDIGHKFEYMCLGPEQCIWFRENEKIRKAGDWFPILENELAFEGQKYSVFSNYEKWLELQYGDFWSFPRKIGSFHSEEFSDFSDKDKAIIEKMKWNKINT